MELQNGSEQQLVQKLSQTQNKVFEKLDSVKCET